MRGFFSWLILMPLVVAFWLVMAVTSTCVKKGVPWRILGVLFSLAVGGFTVLVGYWFGIEGFTELEGLAYRQVTYPVLGWILIISGSFIAILGILNALIEIKKAE